jgi:acylphosphatase
VRVSGDVQGVGFREFTRRRAIALGLAGFVRNRPDGCVEAVFEGDADAVRAAVEAMREGPRAAHVRDVDVVWSAPTGTLTEFRIAF